MSNSKNYTAEDIQRYVTGQMPAQEMHALEKAALEDSFLADAIEGYSGKIEMGGPSVTDDTGELRNRLEKRLQEEKKILPVSTKWWRVAAVLVLLAGTGTLLYTLVFNSTSTKPVVAKNESVVVPPVSDSFGRDDVSPIESTAVASNQAPSPKRSLKNEKEGRDVAQNSGERRADGKDRLPKLSKSSQERESEPLTAIAEQKQEVASAPEARAFSKSRNAADNTRTAPSQEPPISIFNGKVVNHEDKPVPRATVSVAFKNKEMDVAADSNGYFSFTIPDTLAKVVVTSAGYETANATLRNNFPENKIKLKQNVTLNELAGRTAGVEVTQKKSRNRQSNNMLPEPVTGWTSYQNYIEKNKRIPPENTLHGDVILSFFVNSDGKPSTFTVEKSLSGLLDAEAIRLVKDGPDWKPLQQGNIKATITIRF